MPRSWFLTNSLLVWIFASGNRARACWSRVVFSGVTPPLMRRKANRFCGLANAVSKRVVEIVTSPYGEPPFGGAKIPRSFRRSVCPVGVWRSIGEPTWRW